MRDSQKIKVINLHKGYKVNGSLVNRIVSHTLGCCKAREGEEFELVFLTDKAISPLNKKYKGEDRPTDVLSFDLDGIGEIFISIDKAIANSKIFETTPAEELTLYIIHGILHLRGYDDLTRSKRARMERQQGIILRKLCKNETLSKVLTQR